VAVSSAFFHPDGDGFVATPQTRGPWDESAQHGGPPGALLARAVERQLPPGFRLARLTLDLLRPVPIGRVIPRASVRVGRRVARAQVVLEAEGVEVVTGTAVGQRVADPPLDLPAPGPTGPTGGTGGTGGRADGTRPPLPPPEEGEVPPFFAVKWDEGYHTAMAWSFVRGTWSEVGSSQVWMAQRVPLVAGEEPSPFQRVVVVADAGNGVSAAVDFARFSFVNSDLSVHLHRDPAGEWIGMDARTVVQPTSAGLATTVLHDRQGPVGAGNQTLVIGPYG
jgi:hypothetical protein